jgi:hypothetical protein
MVFICGLGGALWGRIAGDGSRRFLSLWGALAGLLVYYLFFGLVWPHANPLIPLYAPELQTQVGFVLWGLALGRSPVYARRIAGIEGERR